MKTMVTVKYPRQFGSTKRESFVVWVDWKNGESDHSLLEKVFNGCNSGSGEEFPMFLDLKIRSLSTGDFVGIGGVWYQCMSVGWKAVSPSQMERILDLPAYDAGGVYAEIQQSGLTPVEK